MRYLLDTHVWLWLQTEPERLSDKLVDQLALAETLLLSAASVWEISIKHALGKLMLPESPHVYVPDRMRRSGVESLPIQATHALAAGALPPHHRDPFDRMIVAQSQLMAVPLVTADDQLLSYDLDTIHVI